MVTSDSTLIASAQNYCVFETQHGREPVFSWELAGTDSTWREQRLFAQAMVEWQLYQILIQNDFSGESRQEFRDQLYGVVSDMNKHRIEPLSAEEIDARIQSFAAQAKNSVQSPI